MSTYPCDQIAVDAFELRQEILDETGIDICFDIKQIDDIVEAIEQMWRDGFSDPNEIKESVFGGYVFLHDLERAAYEDLIGTIFKRRMGERSRMNSRNGKWAKFVPIEQYA